MRGLTEINSMNTKAALAKAQFLAKATNNPKDWVEQKTKLGGVRRVGLSQKAARREDFYGTNL